MNLNIIRSSTHPRFKPYFKGIKRRMYIRGHGHYILEAVYVRAIKFQESIDLTETFHDGPHPGCIVTLQTTHGT